MNDSENIDIPTREELLRNLHRLSDRQKANIPTMIKDANEAIDIGLQLMVIDRPRKGTSVEFPLLREFQETVQKLSLIALRLATQTEGEAAAANKH
jgi:ABC-type cobalamin/Fe3+-siderophores transport system ATPase subunit